MGSRPMFNLVQIELLIGSRVTFCHLRTLRTFTFRTDSVAPRVSPVAFRLHPHRLESVGTTAALQRTPQDILDTSTLPSTRESCTTGLQ